MTSTWRAAAETLVSDLRHVFAGRLRSVVAYGPHIEGVDEAPLTCLALVESLSVSDLEACARVEPEWERRRLATPLMVPEDEFRRSLDAFPLEYGEIVRAHERVFGPDPFDGVEIRREDLRRACETQVKSHLVHLREGFIESGNRPQRVAATGHRLGACVCGAPSTRGATHRRAHDVALRVHTRRRPRRRHPGRRGSRRPGARTAVQAADGRRRAPVPILPGRRRATRPDDRHMAHVSHKEHEDGLATKDTARPSRHERAAAFAAPPPAGAVTRHELLRQKSKLQPSVTQVTTC